MEVKNEGVTLSLIYPTAPVSEVEMEKENPQITILKRERVHPITQNPSVGPTEQPLSRAQKTAATLHTASKMSIWWHSFPQKTAPHRKPYICIAQLPSKVEKSHENSYHGCCSNRNL